MNKKGIATDALILAVISIIVLLVVAGIFSSSFQEFGKKLFGFGEKLSPEDFERSCSYNNGFCAQNINSCKKGVIQEPINGWKDNCRICCKNV